MMAGISAIRFGVCDIVTRPAGCCWCCALSIVQFGFCGRFGSVVGVQPGGGAAAVIAPSVLNSTPAEAVVSLDTTVLFQKVTLSASWSDAPPPSYPATLLAMMLFVTVTPYHCEGVPGK